MKRLSHILAYLFYLGVALVITWPLATVFTTHLVGHPFSDSYEYIRHIWWIKHALQTGQPLFFQPLLAYPDGLPGAWLWSAPLQSFPAWLFAFIMPLPAAYNLQALLTLALNGWALYWLVWKLTGQRGAALLAGVAFMAFPAMQGQIAAGHVGLLVLWPAPLYFYVLLRVRETGDLRWIGLGALLFVLSLSGNLLLLMYVLFPLTALLALSLLVERNWRWLRRVVLVVVLGGALSLIFILPTVFESLSAPLREGGEITFSADLLTIVTPSFQHPVFGNLEYTHRILGEDPFEKPGYVGILAALLSAIAVWRRKEARWWLLLAFIAWVLSLGPLLKVMGELLRIRVGEYESYVTLPWAALHNLPLVSIARTPARFNLSVGLAVAVMAGYGVAELLPRRRRLEALRLPNERSPLEKGWSLGRGSNEPASSRLPETPATGLPASGGEHLTRLLQGEILCYAIMALAVTAILWEYQLFWSGMPTIPGVVPEPIAHLAQRDDVRAVFDIPWEHLLTDKDALFLQTGHQRPLIAGHVTRRTPVNPAKLWLLQATLDPVLLNAAGADIIILHKEWDDAEGGLEAFARERLGEPFYEDRYIAAWEAPETQDEPQFTTLVTPLETVSDQADSYFYTPDSGWVALDGQLQASGRTVELLLDHQPVHAWMIEGETTVRVPLFVDAGYHTLRLSLQPACPPHHDPALRCRSLQINGLSLADFMPVSDSPVQFERGVQLVGSRLERVGDHIELWLHWRFNQPLGESDVRFIHVIDTNGYQLVAQDDRTLGNRPARSQWAELIEIPLPNELLSGSHTLYVYTGWYTYPELRRFAVQDGVPGSVDSRVHLGTIELP